ncbi:MAG: hypothetical protein ABIH01_00415 [Candidatus Omnitrophota bacterium]
MKSKIKNKKPKTHIKMEILADFHIHSRYNRTTSPAMNIKDLSAQAKLKGISPKREFPQQIAEGIIKVRKGEVKIEPGYDGEYGKIRIFDEQTKQDKQLTLF